VLVRGWSEGSIQQKAKAEVAVGSLRSEKAEEVGVLARPGEEGILARIVGQGSNSHQNMIYVFLYSCIHTCRYSYFPGPRDCNYDVRRKIRIDLFNGCIDMLKCAAKHLLVEISIQEWT